MIYLIVSLLVLCICLALISASYIGMTVKKPVKCVFKFNAPEAVQGVAYYKGSIYVLGTDRIGIYQPNGTKIDTVQQRFSHLHSIAAYRDRIYVVNSPGDTNSVEIFDMNLKHLETDRVALGHDRVLAWIYNQGNEWYGVIAAFGQEQDQTRFVKFNSRWEIIESWKLPENVLKAMYPSSSAGGSVLPDGTVYMTDASSKNIFIMQIGQDDTLVYSETIETPLTGNGIDVSATNGRIIYGINNKTKEVMAIKQC